MEEKGTAETTATETVKHLPTKDEHAFGTHLKEEHSREHRGKTTSTIILTVVFIALLATYIYLHGSDRFDVFQPKPTSSTVQPVPIIPWEDYKKQHPQQSSTPQPSVTSPQPSDSSTPSKTRRYTHRIITSHRRRRHPQTLLHGHRLCHTAIVSVFPYLMSLVALTPTNLLE